MHDADERTSGQDSATGPGAANCNARAAELPGSCFNTRVDHVKRQAAVGAERDRDLVLCPVQVGQEQIPVLVEFDRDGRNIGSVCRPAARNCASYRTGVKLSIAALDAAVARLANDLDMLGEAKLQRPPAGRG